MVSSTLFTNLIPESWLLQDIAPLWQRRFEKAVLHIHENYSEPLTTDSIATACAVSPFHLHRMFQLAFGESLGRYISRTRLQYAVDQLLEHPERTTLEIAINTGFSSSQALAKALKRDIGMTASEIRKMRTECAHEAMTQLLNQLGHPPHQTPASHTLEEQLASDIQFTLTQQPERYFQCQSVSPPTNKNIRHAWRTRADQRKNKKVMITWDDPYSIPFDKLTTWVGYQTTSPQQANITLSESVYLQCHIKVLSEIAYFEAWGAMLRHIMEAGYDIHADTPAVEFFHNPDKLAAQQITLSLPISLPSGTTET